MNRFRGFIFLGFIVFALIAGATRACAQDTAIAYTGVIPVQDVSSSDLYARARSWFATTYRNSKAVLQLEDKEGGKLVGKALFVFRPVGIAAGSVMQGPVNYTITIAVKDGRYKYTLTDFIHEDTPVPGSRPSDLGLLTSSESHPRPRKGEIKSILNKQWRAVKEQADAHAATIVRSLTEAMSKPAGPEVDW